MDLDFDFIKYSDNQAIDLNKFKNRTMHNNHVTKFGTMGVRTQNRFCFLGIRIVTFMSYSNKLQLARTCHRTRARKIRHACKCISDLK
jgi:hypothetical protein